MELHFLTRNQDILDILAYGYKRSGFYIIVPAVFHEILDSLPCLWRKLDLIKNDGRLSLFQFGSVFKLQAHENTVQVGHVIEQVPDFCRTGSKIHQYVGLVFIGRKLFGYGGLSNTSCALYQYGCPAFIRPLPLQQLLVYFSFEYHITVFNREQR